eukprot:7802192-Lingulodinium_polyedra.AAC.1
MYSFNFLGGVASGSSVALCASPRPRDLWISGSEILCMMSASFQQSVSSQSNMNTLSLPMGSHVSNSVIVEAVEGH